MSPFRTQRLKGCHNFFLCVMLYKGFVQIRQKCWGRVISNARSYMSQYANSILVKKVPLKRVRLIFAIQQIERPGHIKITLQAVIKILYNVIGWQSMLQSNPVQEPIYNLWRFKFSIVKVWGQTCNAVLKVFKFLACKHWMDMPSEATSHSIITALE